MYIDISNLSKKIEEEINVLRSLVKKRPKILALKDNNDSSTEKYLESLCKLANKYNIDLDYKKSDDMLFDISSLNDDPSINGIFVTKPTNTISEINVSKIINPKKDIEGISIYNLGNLIYENEVFIPCTAEACSEIILDNIDITGKTVAILGRSITVGKPLSIILQSHKRNATVININSKTKNAEDLSKLADVVVAAVGKKEFIDEKYIKNNALVIDVGINVFNNSIYGDVDSNVSNFANLTPVPGGVGTITSNLFMRNAYKATKIQNEV